MQSECQLFERYKLPLIEISLQEGRYTGDIEEGSLFGEGEFTQDDGRYYKGTFIKGVACGQGVIENLKMNPPRIYQSISKEETLIEPNLNLLGPWIIYKGGIYENQANGIGVLGFQHEIQLEGSFKDGVPNGHCKLKFSKNLFIEGTYNNGVANGIFSFYYYDLGILIQKMYLKNMLQASHPIQSFEIKKPTYIVRSYTRPNEIEMPFNQQLLRKTLKSIRDESKENRSPETRSSGKRIINRAQRTIKSFKLDKQKRFGKKDKHGTKMQVKEKPIKGLFQSLLN